VGLKIVAVGVVEFHYKIYLKLWKSN